ncbi:hypothetical protein AGMMS49965_18270 [Bacteroidia bacterium]|nr:hypothetical protein AGMMS49965_18270 [Bacteroidia bacterium]
MKKILIFATVLCLFAFGNKAMAINASFSVGNSYADHQCWYNITSQVVKTGYIELKPSVYNGTFDHYGVYLRNVNDLNTNLASWTHITSTSQNSERCGVNINTAGTYRVCIVVYNSSGAELINTKNNSSYNFTVVSSSYPFVSTGSSSNVTCNSAQLSGGCNVSGYGCRGVRYRVSGSSSWTYVSDNSDFINVTGLSQSTTYQWTYWGDYSAGIEAGEVRSFTTLSTPSTPSSISGLTTVCAGGGQQNYYISQVSGATSYTWDYPSGWSLTGYYSSGSDWDVWLTPSSNAQNGYVTVKANNSCGSSSEQRVYVTVNPAPSTPISISGSTTVCAGGGQQNYYISQVSGATSYTWDYPSGWSLTGYYSSGSDWDVYLTPSSSAQSGYVTVKANNSCGSSSERSIYVTVNFTPSTPGTILGSTTVCAGGGSQSYSISSVSGATSYTWTLPSGWSGSSTGTSISATPGSSASSGTITVKANNSCGSSSTRSLSVTVNTQSVAPTSISGTSTIVSGNSTTLSVSGGSLGTGATWKWYRGSCDGIAVGTGSNITVSPTSTTTYYVRAEGACNTTSCASKTVVIDDVTLDVSADSYNFTASGGTSSDITIASNQSWTISDDASWLTTSKTNGSGNSTFTMTAQANTSNSSRTAIVTLTGGTSGITTVSVTQDPVPTHTITASAGSGGSISPSGQVQVTSGDNQRFTFAPSSSCYEINQVLVDGAADATAKANGSYTFSNVTAPHTISVSFTQKSYSITASAGTGGSISPSGTANVTCGDSKSYTITPNSGYQISQVLVDGSDVGAVSSYTFPNVTAEHTISASFTQIPPATYTITATASSGGSISPSGDVTVSAGGSETFTAMPNSGKEVDIWKKDGSTVQTGGTSYTVSNVTAYTTIEVTFKDVSLACEVKPLLTTYWAQRAPYNNLVNSKLNQYYPTGSSYNYPTGCVATAMAQIMNYHQHPIQRTRSIPSYKTDNLQISVPAITGTTTYDWANMKNTTNEYTTTTQENAVAELMYECGVAVHMNYEPGGSGAYVLENKTNYTSFAVLPTYFGYDNSIQSKWRGNLNTEWDDLLISDLNAGRPILYIGYEPDGGHAFVCDGYSCNTDAYGRRYFHFNWGWGEASQGNNNNANNGYFVSSALNIHDYAFNGSQGIIYNIKPNSAAYIDPTNADGTRTFAISATAHSGGYIIPDGIAIRYAGENQPVSFAANSGYEINEVLVDGTLDDAAKANGYYIFPNVTTNHTISVTFKASSTGVKEVQAQEKISIFPNPAKDEIFIKSEKPIEKVEILDIAGRVVASTNSTTVDVATLPQGIYLVKILFIDRQSTVQKIIKK